MCLLQLTRKRPVSALLGLALLFSQSLLPTSQARRLDTQSPAVSKPDATYNDGDDYIDDYIGVNEDTLGAGPNGKVVLEDIFGSGLNNDDEIIRNVDKFTSRKDENVGSLTVTSSSGDPALNVDLQGTIDQVQRILEANPDLPRLSRSEILEIYRNITSANNTLTTQSQEPNTIKPTTPQSVKPRDDSKKSLLVVLPFNANDMKDSNIEDLYTKRPITQMIGADFEIPVKVTPHKTSEDKSQEHNSNGVIPSPVYKPPASSLHTTGARPTTNQYRQTINSYNRTKTSYTTTPNPGYTSTTKKVSTNTHKNHNHAPTTSSPVSHSQQTNRYENNVINTNREIASSTQRPTLVQYEKRKKPQPVESSQESHKTNPHPAIVQYQDVNPFRPITPPKLAASKPSNLNEEYYSAAHDSNKVNSNGFYPLVDTKPRKTTPQTTVASSGDWVVTERPVVRNDIQSVLASLGLFPAKNNEQVVSAETEKPEKEVVLTPDMKNVLESLGLLPSSSNIQTVVHREPTTTTTEELFVPKPASSTTNIESYSNFKPLPSSQASTMDNKDVSSELKEILANFGLVPGSDLGQGTLNFDTLDQIDITGHRGQKAMPTEKTKNSVKSESTRNKTGKRDKMPEFNVDALSDEMKGVLENLGLVTTTSKSTTSAWKDERHIFNPVVHAASLNHTEAQYERLNQLINTIQLLAKDNETFTQEELDELNAAFNIQPIMENQLERANKSEIQSITKDNNVLPLDQLLDGPDPLSTDELINLYIKNEVKRQEPTNETTTTTTEFPSSPSIMLGYAGDTTTPESTAERVPTLPDFSDSLGGETGVTEDGGASISDLEDSFGGGGEDETAEQNTDSTTKKNGLYFLLDWNSFLEVGEEGKNKTVIRFTPRVGNPKNFLPVTVP